MVYNVPTIQMVIVDAGEVLLDFSVTDVTLDTMEQIQRVDVKVREFSTNNYMYNQSETASVRANNLMIA